MHSFVYISSFWIQKNERKQMTLMEVEEEENEKIKLTSKIDDEKVYIKAFP